MQIPESRGQPSLLLGMHLRLWTKWQLNQSGSAANIKYKIYTLNLTKSACGVRAVIGEHSTGLGICVIAAVPGRIAADAPYAPIGVYIT